MTTNQDELSASWHAEDVDASTVERALNRLIQEMNPHDGGEPYPPARASVLNLIVRATDHAEEARAVGALGEVAGLHPSRTLVVATDPAAEPGLDASVSAHCRLKPGIPARVCTEEVRLTARGGMTGQVASVVAPLLVPDLPVFLWWLRDQPEADEELLPLCDRLIVDSSPLDPTGLVNLERLVATLGGRVVVGDLAWSALEPWRELLAQLFDPPEARPYQRQLTVVRLHYVAGGPIAQPLLLLGWLAASLGWSLEASAGQATGDGHSLKFQGSSGSVAVYLNPVSLTGNWLEPGEMLATTLTAGRGVQQATFSVEREDDQLCAEVRAVLPGRPISAHTLSLARPSLAARLSEELEQMARAPLYHESLVWAERIAREAMA